MNQQLKAIQNVLRIMALLLLYIAVMVTMIAMPTKEEEPKDLAKLVPIHVEAGDTTPLPELPKRLPSGF